MCFFFLFLPHLFYELAVSSNVVHRSIQVDVTRKPFHASLAWEVLTKVCSSLFARPIAFPIAFLCLQFHVSLITFLMILTTLMLLVGSDDADIVDDVDDDNIDDLDFNEITTRASKKGHSPHTHKL